MTCSCCLLHPFIIFQAWDRGRKPSWYERENLLNTRKGEVATRFACLFSRRVNMSTTFSFLFLTFNSFIHTVYWISFQSHCYSNWYASEHFFFSVPDIQIMKNLLFQSFSSFPLIFKPSISFHEQKKRWKEGMGEDFLLLVSSPSSKWEKLSIIIMISE